MDALNAEKIPPHHIPGTTSVAEDDETVSLNLSSSSGGGTHQQHSQRPVATLFRH